MLQYFTPHRAGAAKKCLGTTHGLHSPARGRRERRPRIAVAGAVCLLALTYDGQLRRSGDDMDTCCGARVAVESDSWPFSGPCQCPANALPMPCQYHGNELVPGTDKDTRLLLNSDCRERLTMEGSPASCSLQPCRVGCRKSVIDTMGEPKGGSVDPTSGGQHAQSSTTPWEISRTLPPQNSGQSACQPLEQPPIGPQSPPGRFHPHGSTSGPRHRPLPRRVQQPRSPPSGGPALGARLGPRLLSLPTEFGRIGLVSPLLPHPTARPPLPHSGAGCRWSCLDEARSETARFDAEM